jgi:integrase
LLDSLPATLTEWIFPNPDTGRAYTHHLPEIAWNPYCKNAIGYLCPLNNAGRHSFGTRLAKAGVDLDLISKMLRHSDSRVTKAHYAEPDLNVMKKAVDRLRKA